MPAFLCVLWRSVWLPRVVVVISLVAGLPLFLRMPPWCDVTLYQMAARNMLNGGVHYQHIFDTNLPGYAWIITLIQWVFGPSVFAIRVADLAVVLGLVLVIDRLAKWGGATPSARWWAFAGAAMLYPFTVEMAHAQRDTWMALPAFTALALRVRRLIERPPHPSPLEGKGNNTSGSIFRRSVLEGMLWGAAVWIKPHVVLMAAAAWLLTARRLASGHRRPWRASGADLLGNLFGGVLVGLAGVSWLVATGAWGPFVDVFLNWNPDYLQLAWREFDDRMKVQLNWYPPWSLWLIPTLPLALASVLDAAPWAGRAGISSPDRGGPVGRRLPGWLWDKQASPEMRFVRGVMGGLYLVWAAQAAFIQREFQYVHTTETLLMLGLWASHRWAWAALVLLWVLVTSGWCLIADTNPDMKSYLDTMPTKTRDHCVYRHPMTCPKRMELWPTCWRTDLSDTERYALWDKLRMHPPHEAVISWEELSEVAEFLRSQGVKDGGVSAWLDSPPAIYLMLDLDPGMRFMHISTAMGIGSDAGSKGMAERAKKRRARFVINDLEWVSQGYTGEERRSRLGPPRNPPHDLLPLYSPNIHDFPFNQPTVFRTRNGQGRYIVHRIVTRECDPPHIRLIPSAASSILQSASCPPREE